MRHFFLLALAATVVSGCARMSYNDISVRPSEFDDATEYRMHPGAVKDTHVLVGLIWEDNIPDQLYFDVHLPRYIANIASRGGLQFNIDGDITMLGSLQATTTFGSSGGSRKRFIGSVELLDRILSADSVKLRVIANIPERAREGDFSFEGNGYAITGFREFRNTIDATTQAAK